MTLDDALSTAFARWIEARAELGRLRAQGAAEANGRQLAASPEASALFQSILDQQAVCTRLWDELSRVAEARAAMGDAKGHTESQRSMLPPPGSDAGLE